MPDITSSPFSKASNERSDVPENKPCQEDSDSDEEEDDGVDPVVKEKERKISEKRILEIVHKDEGITDSSHNLSKNEREGSKGDTSAIKERADIEGTSLENL